DGSVRIPLSGAAMRDEWVFCRGYDTYRLLLADSQRKPMLATASAETLCSRPVAARLFKQWFGREPVVDGLAASVGAALSPPGPAVWAERLDPRSAVL